MIDISKLDRADVLAALFNAAKTQGLGALHYQDRTMGREEAAGILKGGEGQTYFDYYEGRIMAVDLSTDEVDPRLYDRDNGEGAAARAIEAIAA